MYHGQEQLSLVPYVIFRDTRTDRKSPLHGIPFSVPKSGCEMLVIPEDLEAQQRYFSYRAILVAIVSQTSFVLVFMGYRTIIARYVAKWGIAQMHLCETKYPGGVSHPFRELLTSLKKCRAIWGIAAIVSQDRAIWGHYA